MIEQKQSHPDKSTHRNASKPGSDPVDTDKTVLSGDFGVSESKTIERDYTSKNTKSHDPGNAQPRAGEDDDRQSGVGANRSGVGSGSGGDIDTDIVGLDGRGLAANVPDTRPDRSIDKKKTPDSDSDE